MSKKRLDLREIIIRFIIGGTVVVLCYLISVFSPVKYIGGIFAAFPAVMAAAVSMAGLRDGSKKAAEVATGAVSGMIGSTACVLAAIYLMGVLKSWPLGLAGALVVWAAVSLALSTVFSARNRNGLKQRGS